VEPEQFVQECFPAQLLDLLELTRQVLDAEKRVAFQAEMNNAFEEEGCPWRIADTQFFQVDSQFLSQAVMARTHELLTTEGFMGALEEFREARTELQSGDHKGAIHKACNSLESALKTILKRQDGTASTLIRKFLEQGFCNDLPAETTKSMESVLMALPTLRNKLGGHGQGENTVDVPRPYAELAIHIAGSLIQFVVSKSLPQEASKEEEPPSTTGLSDDDIPF